MAMFVKRCLAHRVRVQRSPIGLALHAFVPLDRHSFYLASAGLKQTKNYSRFRSCRHRFVPKLTVLFVSHCVAFIKENLEYNSAYFQGARAVYREDGYERTRHGLGA